MTARSTNGFQASHHGPDHDYADGSPHLKHPRLRNWVQRSVLDAVGLSRPALGLRPRVLEVGAGHGSLTDVLVAGGADVVVTEMSEHSTKVLQDRFRDRPEVCAVHDPDGEMAVDGSFDAVVYISVLHHIPDYLGAVVRATDRLRPGGALISFQDPLWYPRQSHLSLLLSRAIYAEWRLRRGELRRGLAAAVRRRRGRYDETDASDMMEYHVVREGVDEEALKQVLSPLFASVRVLPYWSAQSTWGQRVGETLPFPNTFGLVASGRLPAYERP